MTCRLAVIGDPVTQSASPIIHNFWIQYHHLAAEYHVWQVEAGQVESVLHSLADKGYRGINVTVPHKETVYQLLGEARLSEQAKQVKAVNTVVVGEDGSLFGDNTDVDGFIDNIKYHVPEFSFRNKRVLLLGAGGAARAICVGLKREGVNSVVITNRTRERAESLAQEFGEMFEVVDWEKKDAIVPEVDMVVNATLLGMRGQLPLEIHLEALADKAIVSDIVYKPLMTPLLKQAQEQGNCVVDGLGMLLYQAVPAFERWFGIRPQVGNALRELVLRQ